MDSLYFSATFPFSEKAKLHLKDLGLSVADVREPALKRSALLISRAVSLKPYSPDFSSKEALENELIAFPAAKMLLSLMNTPLVIEKFSSIIQKNTFSFLVNSKEVKDLCIELARDFKVSFSLSSDESFFVELPLLEYLNINFANSELKLVNKRLDNGKVFLDLNDFARFLSEKAYKKVFDSLPISKEHIPGTFVSLARSLDSQLIVREKKEFDLKLEGKIDPNFFPPCMKVLYADQLAGKKLSYMGRLALASFLFQLGMSKTELSNLFAKSPDYKKHIADYHINRIFDKKLSAPGCKKMAEYGLKVSECGKECLSSHPLKYYLRELRVNNRKKNFEEQAGGKSTL